MSLGDGVCNFACALCFSCSAIVAITCTNHLIQLFIPKINRQYTVQLIARGFVFLWESNPTIDGTADVKALNNWKTVSTEWIGERESSKDFVDYYKSFCGFITLLAEIFFLIRFSQGKLFNSSAHLAINPIKCVVLPLLALWGHCAQLISSHHKLFWPRRVRSLWVRCGQMYDASWVEIKVWETGTSQLLTSVHLLNKQPETGHVYSNTPTHILKHTRKHKISGQTVWSLNWQ